MRRAVPQRAVRQGDALGVGEVLSGEACRKARAAQALGRIAVAESWPTLPVLPSCGLRRGEGVEPRVPGERCQLLRRPHGRDHGRQGRDFVGDAEGGVFSRPREARRRSRRGGIRIDAGLEDGAWPCADVRDYLKGELTGSLRGEARANMPAVAGSSGPYEDPLRGS